MLLDGNLPPQPSVLTAGIVKQPGCMRKRACSRMLTAAEVEGTLMRGKGQWQGQPSLLHEKSQKRLNYLQVAACSGMLMRA